LSEIKFSLNLAATSEKLMQVATDYSNLSKYCPQQLKSIEIVEQNNDGIITEEIISLSMFKKEIKQKTLHKNSSNNKLHSEIISGPAKGTTINILYEKMDSGTKVMININLKISLTFKILQPLIEKYYKLMMTSILFRMNTVALQI
jgi:hypothetical protein